MAVRICLGVISDTHGLLRPEAVAALEGSHTIVHAGDVGSPEVLEALERVAPVRAVRGNVDRGMWAQTLPETDLIEVGEVCLYVLHQLTALDMEPSAAGVDVVISGHSHQPRSERQNGVLYLNPGSAGPRRFRLPVSVARLIIEGRQIASQILELSV
jgi:putative phosphoesterase